MGTTRYTRNIDTYSRHIFVVPGEFKLFASGKIFQMKKLMRSLRNYLYLQDVLWDE